MQCVNKVILVGKVGEDPKVMTFQNGGKCANFSLVTTETYKDKTTGENKYIDEWHKIAVFNTSYLTVIEKYVKKGTELYLEGEIKKRKYLDKNGEEKSITEVVLRNFKGELKLLGSNSTFKQSEISSPPEDVSKSLIDLDDDLPF